MIERYQLSLKNGYSAFISLDNDQFWYRASKLAPMLYLLQRGEHSCKTDTFEYYHTYEAMALEIKQLPAHQWQLEDNAIAFNPNLNELTQAGEIFTLQNQISQLNNQQLIDFMLVSYYYTQQMKAYLITGNGIPIAQLKYKISYQTLLDWMSGS